MKLLFRIIAAVVVGVLSVLAVQLVIRRLYHRLGSRYYEHSSWDAGDGGE